MAITAAAIQATVSISGADKAKSDLQGVSSSVNETSSRLASLAGGVALAAGAAFVGIGVASTKMAADFQTNITTLKTGAGESAANLKAVSAGILQMAVDTGASTKQLTDGMYMIESAGYHGADGLKVLQAAAEGAKVGNADLGTVANALTTVMNNYHLPVTQAASATNDLIATVANGKTTLGDLSGALANVLPIASSAGVSLLDVSGAMATMTGAGVPAADAATYLRQTIMALENPTSKASGEMKNLGLSSSAVAAEMKVSLPDALQMITDAAGKKFPVGSAGYVSAIATMVGGTKSLQGITLLAGANLDTFKGNVINISGAVKAGGNSIQGWSDVQSTFNFKIQKAQEVMETLGIKIGEKLLPSLSKLVDGFSSPAFEKFATTMGDDLANALQKSVDGISKLVLGITQMVNFFQKNQAAMETAKIVTLALAGAIGGALAFAFYTAAAAAFTAAGAFLAAAAIPILIGLAIGLAVAGIVLAVQHWGEISKWLQDQWKTVSTFFSGLWKDIQGFFGGVGQWFTDRFNEAKKGIQSAFGNVGQWFQDRWKDTQNAWGGAGQWFHDRGTEASNGTKSTFQNIGSWFHDRFTEAYTAITNVFGGIGKWFADRWNDIYIAEKPLINYVTQVFQTIWNIIVALFGKLGQWFHDRWQEVVVVFTPVGQWFHDRFNEAWTAVTNVFTAMGQWFGARWKDTQNVFAAIGSWFHDRWNEAWTAITGVFSAIGSWFSARYKDTQNVFATVGSWFHDRFNEAWAAITGIFTTIGGWFSARWHDVQAIFSVVGSWFHDRFTEAWNSIVTLFTPIGNWFHDRWNSVMDGVNAFKDSVVAKFNELKTDAFNVFRGLINGIVDQLNNGISAVEGFINGIGQGLDGIAKALGTTGTIEVVHLGRIPHYATGTDAHPGGPAMVGERGPEMVFLPKGTKVAPNNVTEMLLAGGKIPGYAGGIGDIASSILGWIGGGAKSILDNVMNAMNIHLSLPSGMGNIATGLVNKVKDWAVSWIEKVLPKFGGLGPDGKPVNIPGNVQSWIATAMGLTGAPASWANDLGIIAMKESGGNQNAINLTDSNAQAGHPSQGLFQMIPSTFAAHMLAGHTNILSPIDNAASAIEYIMSRYGDVFHVPGIESLASGGSYVGYAGGVANAPGGFAMVGERGPELMYVPRGAQITPNSQLNSLQGGTVVHVHNYIDGKEITDNTANRIVKSSRGIGPIRSNS